MDKIDDGLKTLLESGKEKGYLDLRPGQRLSSRRRHQPREDRPDPHHARGSGHRADRRGRGRGARRAAPPPPSTTRSAPSWTSASSTRKRAAASTTRCACTSRRWARSRCSSATGNRPGQEDRGHPQALPPQSAGMRLRPAPSRGRPQARPHRRPALRPHGQGVADREPRKRQDPPAHAAQPQDARTPAGTEPRRLRPASSTRNSRRKIAAACAASSASAAARPSRWSKSCRSARRRSSR